MKQEKLPAKPVAWAGLIKVCFRQTFQDVPKLLSLASCAPQPANGRLPFYQRFSLLIAFRYQPVSLDACSENFPPPAELVILCVNATKRRGQRLLSADLSLFQVPAARPASILEGVFTLFMSSAFTRAGALLLWKSPQLFQPGCDRLSQESGSSSRRRNPIPNIRGPAFTATQGPIGPMKTGDRPLSLRIAAASSFPCSGLLP